MRKFLSFIRLFLSKFFDDLLMVGGCVCILIGLSRWNVIVTWIMGGLMLIGFGLLVGKVRSKNADNRPS